MASSLEQRLYLHWKDAGRTWYTLIPERGDTLEAPGDRMVPRASRIRGALSVRSGRSATDTVPAVSSTMS